MLKLWRSPVFRWTILGIFLLEILSFFAWLLPVFGNVAFFVILGVLLVASLKDLRYGMAAVLAELIVGSHGYLFVFQQEGLAISFRMGLFLVVFVVGVVNVFKEKRLEIYHSKYFWPLVVLAVAIAYAFLLGASGNGLVAAFMDGNGYVFFALALPFWQAFKKKDDLSILLHASVAALLASVAKVFFISYTFSHKFWWMMPETYRWIRDTRIGEITEVTEVFFRIFFASQIYSAIAFVVVFVFLLAFHQREKFRSLIRNKSWWLTVGFAALLLSSTLISLSRSNWVGLVVAALVLIVAFFLIYKNPFKQIGLSILYTVSLTILSAIIITVTVIFPFPSPAGGFSARSLFTARAFSLGGEAAIDSRFGLLPPMQQAIKDRPILGYGFGKTLTYITKDPRILAEIPSGEYTTHAFEWGYLELWIKLGLIGLLIYLGFYFLLIKDSVKYLWKYKPLSSPDPSPKRPRSAADCFGDGSDEHSLLILGLFLGGIVLLATHAFSPYLNHPLGIGYLLIWALFTERFSRRNSTSSQLDK